MSSVSFDVSDVRSEASPDPWERRDNFAEEINEDDMADDAAQYAAAADEAQTVSELARLAAQEGSDAAEYDGQDLIDRAGQEDLTAQDLGNNGEAIDRTVTNLLRAVAAAQDTKEEVDGFIDGEGGREPLDDVVEQYSDDAVEVYDGFVSYLEGENSRFAELGNVQESSSSPILDSAIGADRPAVIPTPVLTYGESEYNAAGSPGSWGMPMPLTAKIRDTHIEAAASIASQAGRDIDDAVEQYRHDLSQLAVDLGDDGYDASESSFGLWRSEEMAEYNGVQLEAELQRDHPDPDVLYRHTLGLNSALNQMYDDDGNLREDFDPDSSELDDYVNTFLHGVSADSLLALQDLNGEVPPELGPHPGGGLHDQEQIAVVQRAISNGIIASMDPAAGGVDPNDIVRDSDGRVVVDESPDLPPGVVDYLYDMPATLESSPTPGADGGELRAELEKFNGFGQLLGNATVAPGTQFSHDMADNAVEVQQFVDETNQELAHVYDPQTYTHEDGHFDVLETPGGSALLSAASLNGPATAERLADEEFADKVVQSHWSHDAGAADYLRAGTIIPDDLPEDSDAIRNYYEASYNVLSTAGEASTHKNVLDNQEHLTAAIGDVMVEHMDILTADADPGSGFIDFAAEGVDGTRLGEPVDFGFSLSDKEQRGLFDLLNRVDDDIRNDFHADVSQWQAETANHGFSPEGDAGTAVAAVSRAGGYMDRGLLNAVQEGVIDPANARISTIVGIASAGIPFGTAPVMMTTAASEVFRHTAADFPSETDDVEQYLQDNGDVRHRHIIAQAAYENGVLEGDGAASWEDRQLVDVDGIESYMGYDENEPNPIHNELRSNVESIEGYGYPGVHLGADEYDRTFRTDLPD